MTYSDYEGFKRKLGTKLIAPPPVNLAALVAELEEALRKERLEVARLRDIIAYSERSGD